MIQEMKALLNLSPQQFADAEIEKSEFVDWITDATTEKVMRLVFTQRQLISEQLAQGETLGIGCEQATAQAVGLIAGLDYLLTMEYDDQDERGEDDSDTTDEVLD